MNSLGITAFLISCSLASAAQTAQPQKAGSYSQDLTQNGINVRVSVEHLDTAKTDRDPLEEGEQVRVRFRLTDAATDSSLSGASPAAWIDHKPDGEKTTPAQCVGKVKRFAEGSTFSRTAVDLTAFYVAMMNDDATLTVVDPRFGYGDTRLLALVSLESPGEDWALTGDGSRLFVSMPRSGKIAVIDAATWKVISNVDAGPHNGRLAIQPDEAYVWSAYDADAQGSGVTVIRVRDLKTIARIPTGRGYHHIAFNPDSSLAFVTNPADGTVSVIDVRHLVKMKDLAIGRGPAWITYSSLAQAAYVANEGDGAIVAIDGKEPKVLARMESAPGLGQIRVVPGGRFVVAVNPANDHLYVVDAALNRIVQTALLDKQPDQITFTNKQIHVRHRGSDSVLMISLGSLGEEGKSLSVASFTSGHHPAGQLTRPTPADGLVQASGENGVLVANPGDKSVYFYMEGMAAPMGNFSNYGHQPLAVLSVERNLREQSSGVYETTIKLPQAGAYDLAFLLDRPRVVSCFDFPISPDPSLAQYKPPKLRLDALFAQTAKAGSPYRISFKVTDAETNKPATGLADLIVLMDAPGIWQRRQVAQPASNGLYTVEYNVPKPGIYRIFAAVPSMGLNYVQYATVTVEDTSD